MKQEHEIKFRRQYDQLQRLVNVNAPSVIIGHTLISMARDLLLEGKRSNLELARYLITRDKESLEYYRALNNPESPEAKEMAEIVKEIDDLEIDELMEAYLATQR